MRYVVPANARIELWDSAIAETVADDDTLDSIASRTGAPAWAIAQINNLDENASLQPGRKLMIPRNAVTPDRAKNDGSSDTAIGAARIKR
jgi:LysM repeat protein